MSLTKFATRARMTDLVSASVLSCALFACAPARAQEPNLWDKAMSSVGLGGKPDAGAQQQPAAPQAQQAPQEPVAPQQPGMWDRMTNSIGLGKKPEASTIDYSARPKLTVPQQRDLPRPNPVPERQVSNRVSQEQALTRPPTDYTQKVKGADGKVEGLRDSDFAKSKKFFGLF